jgi:hypothetical protein
MSQTVFREKGYLFSREETRMHVHVSHANGEAKFWLQPIIELAQNFGLSSRELKEVDQMVKTHQQDIKNAWYKHFPN